MQVSDEGLFFLAVHEGIVPGPYRDSVGVWTYGIGHAETSGRMPNPRTMPRGMPDNLDAELRRVIEVFKADIEVYAAAVRRAVKVPLEQHEFDAAVSFHYNTGAIARATWVKQWNAGDKTAARKSIMNWRKPPEIIGRRTAERDLWATGDYGGGRVNVWRVTDAGRVQFGRPVRSLGKAEFMALLDRPTQRPQPPAAPSPRQNPIMALLRAFLERFRGEA